MANSETVDVLVRLRNGRQFVQGAQQSGKAIGGVGKQADQASKAAQRSGSRFSLFRRNLDGSKKSAMGASGAFGRAAKSAAGFAAAFVGFSAAKKAISTTAELAKTTVGLTKTLGLSNEQAGQWAAVAKVRGIATNQLGLAFKTLSGQTEKARKGGQGSIDTFAQLGITQDDLRRGSTDFNFLLGKVADGLNKLPPGTKKVTAASALLGRGWQKLRPVLGAGSKAMNEQLAMATKYGATIGGKPLKSQQDLIAVQRELAFAQLGWQVQFSTKIAPMLVKGADLVLKFTTMIRQHRTAAKAAAVAILGFVVAVKGIGAAKKAIDTTSDAIRGIKTAARATRRVGNMIVDNILPGLRGSPSKIRRALNGARDTIKRVLGRAGTNAGTTAASNTATSMASNVGPQVKRRQGRFDTAGRTAGRRFGGAIGKGAIVGLLLALPLLAIEARKYVDQLLGKIKNDTLRKIAGAFTGAPGLAKAVGIDIPGFATGGVMMRSGPALVGERGPELLNLPARTQITPLESGRGEPRQVALSGGGRGQDIAREIVAALRKEPLATYIDGRLVTAGVARHATNARARQ